MKKIRHHVKILLILVCVGALTACSSRGNNFPKEFYETKPLPKLDKVFTYEQARDKIFEYERDLKAAYAKIEALNTYD